MADGNVALATGKRVGRPPKARGAANSSDMADARWTVRGVPVNVRAMALKACADRGMTAGDWLAEAIVAYARADGKGVSADGGANVPAVNVPPDLVSLVTDMQARLAKIEAEASKPILVRLFGRRG